MDFAEERKAAIQAVCNACRLCVKIQGELVSEDTITKKDRSPVTVADYSAQALIIKQLTEKFDYPFIAEESGDALSKEPEVLNKVFQHVSDEFPNLFNEGEEGKIELVHAIESGHKKNQDTELWWTLDPIDGTMGFLRRGQYAVALCLLQDNEPILGVLGCPSFPVDWNDQEGPKGVILAAVKGQGAFQYTIDEAEESLGVEGGKKISTSNVSNIEECILTESFVKSHGNQSLTSKILNELNAQAEPIRIDSQCKYSLIARGDVSLYLRLSSLSYQEKIWDHGAGVIIVTEAGGCVSDYSGNPLDFSAGHKLINNTGICCTSSPEIHEAVIQAIAKVDHIQVLSSNI
eukprot:TRINITY_DN673_c0_g1_i1.p1 TRINITY_DN673_c0_g1~~TRINITY_DN673_c0_g1_i1.p1  ORF type:complete len:347 (+),score=133.89 TRINITY_DN673_c0_g1_i1:42-1082(+)